MEDPASQSGEGPGTVEDPPPPSQTTLQDASASESLIESTADSQKRPPPPPSPLTGCYLLIVIGEPHSERHKEIILQKISKGFLSWDVNECHVSLEKELQSITVQSPEGEEARYGERLIQYATENLVTEILIHPQLNTLHQCMKNLLSSFTKHRHIIHAGYTFAGNGSWILQDGTLSISDLVEALHESDVLRVLKAYENSVTIDVHCAPEGDWTTKRFQKEPVSTLCKIRVNPGDVMTAGDPAISAFIEYLSPFLEPANIQQLLQPTDVVGNIRFTHPTLYVFPGGQGDAALFGINGFNMLVDGGFSRKACFWDFARHLDRLDAVLLTRLNNSTVNGISAVLQRKKMNHVYPQIGHFFCNLQDRKIALSPDGDKDKDSLIVNLAEEGQEIVANLKHLALKPHPCYRDGNQVDPVNLYHKVGHGKLDMYVISPARDSQAVKEFLSKWSANDNLLFSNTGKKVGGKGFDFPIQNLVSICALLVWQPANPNDTITRILFPGSTPQHKIFEGLDKLRHLEFLKHPVCSAKSISPSASAVTVARSLSKTRQPEDRFKTKSAETAQKSVPEKKKIEIKSKPKAPKQKIDYIKDGEKEESKLDGVKKLEDRMFEKDEKLENITKEIQKIKQESALQKIETDQNEEEVEKQKKKVVHRSKYDMRNVKSKVDSRAPSKSIDRKKIQEKKTETGTSPPITPKKALVNGTGTKPEKSRSLSRTSRSSPNATPGKSVKEANNRKVVEARVTSRATKAPTKAPPAPSAAPAAPPTLPASAKTERKPISRRPKAASPAKKAALSPVRATKAKPAPAKPEVDAATKKIKGKVITDVIKTVSAETTVADEVKKEAKPVQVAQEGKTDEEAVKEKQVEEQKESEASIEIEIKEQAHDEEYLVITKEEPAKLEEEEDKEVEIDSLQEDAKTKDETEGENEIKKIHRDEEDSEKKRKMMDLEAKEEDGQKSPEAKDGMEEEVQKLPLPEDQDEVKEPVSKEQKEGESLPDEKFSTTVETSATTAPTLPEDEKIEELEKDEKEKEVEELPQDEPLPEKHTQEEIKEEVKEEEEPRPEQPASLVKAPSPGVPEEIETPQYKHHVRDLVKTPDEVADLPVHEEVDPGMYSSGEFTKDFQRRPDEDAEVEEVESPNVDFKAGDKGEANILDDDEKEESEMKKLEEDMRETEKQAEKPEDSAGDITNKYLDIIDHLERSTSQEATKEIQEKSPEESADLKKDEPDLDEKVTTDAAVPETQPQESAPVIGQEEAREPSSIPAKEEEKREEAKETEQEFVAPKSPVQEAESPVKVTSPPLLASEEVPSGKSTPEAPIIVKITTDSSGKSTPVSAPKSPELTADIEEVAEVASGKTTPPSAPKTPEILSEAELVAEETTPAKVTDSGKSTPASAPKSPELAADTEIAVEETAPVKMTDSGKSTPPSAPKTPEIAGGTGEVAEATQVKVTDSGKSTPPSAPKTPEITVDTGVKAEAVPVKMTDSGKSTPPSAPKTPEITVDTGVKAEAAPVKITDSGKSTPPSAPKTPEVVAPTEVVAEEAAPVKMTDSGKSTPPSAPKTPEVVVPTEVAVEETAPVKITDSGKSTPPSAPKTPEITVDTGVKAEAAPVKITDSGKSTPPSAPKTPEVMADTEVAVEETAPAKVTDSGKSTPASAPKSPELAADTEIAVEETAPVKMTDSGKSTPPSAPKTPEIVVEPEVKAEAVPVKITDSGKSTPPSAPKTPEVVAPTEVVAEEAAPVKMTDSGKSTPPSAPKTPEVVAPTEVVAEEAAPVKMTDSGKSTPPSAPKTPEIVVEPEVKAEAAPVKTADSGKSTPEKPGKVSQEDKEVTEKVSGQEQKMTPSEMLIQAEKEQYEKDVSHARASPLSKELEDQARISGKSTPEKGPALAEKPFPDTQASDKEDEDSLDEVKSQEDTSAIQERKTPEESVAIGKATPESHPKPEKISTQATTESQSPEEKQISGQDSPATCETSVASPEFVDSGKASPIFLEKVSPSDTPEVPESAALGRESPSALGKKTPQVLEEEATASGKSTPASLKIQEKDVKSTLVSSGKASPDIRDEGFSGKETPDLSDKENLASVEEKEKEASRASTPMQTEVSAKELSSQGSPISSEKDVSENITSISGKESPFSEKDSLGRVTPDRVALSLNGSPEKKKTPSPEVAEGTQKQPSLPGSPHVTDSPKKTEHAKYQVEGVSGKSTPLEAIKSSSITSSLPESPAPSSGIVSPAQSSDRRDASGSEKLPTSGKSTPLERGDGSLTNGVGGLDEELEKGTLESERHEKESQVTDISSGEDEELKALEEGDDGDDSEPDSITRERLQSLTHADFATESASSSPRKKLGSAASSTPVEHITQESAQSSPKGKKDDINNLVKSGMDTDNQAAVKRMLVTTSSEDGGVEIEICPQGSIRLVKAEESKKDEKSLESSDDEKKDEDFGTLVSCAKQEYNLQRSRKSSSHTPEHYSSDECEVDDQGAEPGEFGSLIAQAQKEYERQRSRKSSINSADTEEKQAEGSASPATAVSDPEPSEIEKSDSKQETTAIATEEKKKKEEDESAKTTIAEGDKDEGADITAEEEMGSRKSSVGSTISQEDLVSRKDSSTRIDELRSSSVEMSPLKTTYITSDSGDAETLATSSFYEQEEMLEYRKEKGYESITQIGPDGEKTEKTYFYSADAEASMPSGAFLKGIPESIPEAPEMTFETFPTRDSFLPEDFAKAVDEHRTARGEHLVQPPRAKEDEAEKAPEKDVLEGWGKPLGLPLPPKNARNAAILAGQNISTTSSLSTPSDNSDSISNWGHPMSLPSPAPPTTQNGTGEQKETPKKEAKTIRAVKSDNKGSGANTPNRRSESPVKQPERRALSTGRNKTSSNSFLYLDLTYVPHHGNSYYSNVEFFKRVRARYYVFSGTEPSKEVYNALLEAKQTWEDKDLEVTIIPTYDTDILGYWVAENEEILAKNKIDLSPSASRCTINLQDHETSCSAYRLEF